MPCIRPCFSYRQEFLQSHSRNPSLSRLFLSSFGALALLSFASFRLLLNLFLSGLLSAISSFCHRPPIFPQPLPGKIFSLLRRIRFHHYCVSCSKSNRVSFTYRLTRPLTLPPTSLSLFSLHSRSYGPVFTVPMILPPLPSPPPPYGRRGSCLFSHGADLATSLPLHLCSGSSRFQIPYLFLSRGRASFHVFFLFLDATTHLYNGLCPSVRPSVRRSVGPSVRMSRVIFEGEK